MANAIVLLPKINFLFGAGISRPSGMPSTEEITVKILNGEGVYRETDSNYYMEGQIQVDGRKLLPPILYYLEVLGRHIFDYFGERKKITYEDYFYLARQISDCLDEEIENPGLGLLLKEIQSEERLKRLLIDCEISFSELATEVCHYILDVTARLLSDSPLNLTHMNFLIGALNDKEFDHIDIFTLNHDTVLDQIFKQENILVADGFEEEIYNLRWWAPELFRFKSPRSRIFKLHGAVNWYQMEQDPNVSDLGRVAIVLDGDHWHGRNRKGQRIMSIQHRPLILAGTFNKMMEYSTGIFATNFGYFLESLRESTALVISGYSFGDKGINTAIIEWMYLNSANQIVLIHGDLDQLKRDARWAISGKIDQWITNHRLFHLNKWVQDVRWNEVSPLLPGRF